MMKAFIPATLSSGDICFTTTFILCFVADVDECQLYGSSCNTYSELCIDGIGNYMCTCKKGFTSIFGKCVGK